MPLTATVETAQSVRLDYTVPAGGATLTIARTGPSGVSAAVRTWDAAPVAPGAIIARDFEPPIGVALVYTATTRNGAGAVIDTQTVVLTLPSAGCSDTWLTDLARSANTLQIAIESLPRLDYPIPVTVHDVIGRRAPVVASDLAH